MIDKIICENKLGSDINEILIALLQYAQKGNPLLDKVDREFYNKVRYSYRNNTKDFPDWLYGNVAFLASYNGKGFSGGYAKPVYEKTKTGVRYRDYYAEGKKNLEKQAKNNLFKDINFTVLDYKNICNSNFCKFTSMIYCDPPYANMTNYDSKNFNHNEFWECIRNISNSSFVLISEQNAPVDFVSIWEKPIVRTLNVSNKGKSTEKLFTYKDGLYHKWFQKQKGW